MELFRKEEVWLPGQGTDPLAAQRGGQVAQARLSCGPGLYLEEPASHLQSEQQQKHLPGRSQDQNEAVLAGKPNLEIQGSVRGEQGRLDIQNPFQGPKEETEKGMEDGVAQNMVSS